MKYKRDAFDQWTSAQGEAAYEIMGLVHTEKSWLFRANAMDAFVEEEQPPRDVADFIELQVIHCLRYVPDDEALKRLGRLRTKPDISLENQIRTLVYTVDKKLLSPEEDAIALLREAEEATRSLEDLGLFIDVRLSLSRVILPQQALAELQEAIALARPESPPRWDTKLWLLLERVIELAYDLGLESVRLNALRQLEASRGPLV